MKVGWMGERGGGWGSPSLADWSRPDQVHAGGSEVDPRVKPEDKNSFLQKLLKNGGNLITEDFFWSIK